MSGRTIDKDAIRDTIPEIREFEALRTQQEVIALAFARCEPKAENMVPPAVRAFLKNHARYAINTATSLPLLKEARDDYMALLPQDSEAALRNDAVIPAPDEQPAKRWALRLFGVANAKLAVAYALAIANAWADLNERKRPERYDVLIVSLGTWASGLLRIPQAPTTQHHEPRRDVDDYRRNEAPYHSPRDSRKSGRRD